MSQINAGNPYSLSPTSPVAGRAIEQGAQNLNFKELNRIKLLMNERELAAKLAIAQEDRKTEAEMQKLAEQGMKERQQTEITSREKMELNRQKEENFRHAAETDLQRKQQAWRERVAKQDRRDRLEMYQHDTDLKRAALESSASTRKRRDELKKRIDLRHEGQSKAEAELLAQTEKGREALSAGMVHLTTMEKGHRELEERMVTAGTKFVDTFEQITDIDTPLEELMGDPNKGVIKAGLEQFRRKYFGDWAFARSQRNEAYVEQVRDLKDQMANQADTTLGTLLAEEIPDLSPEQGLQAVKLLSSFDPTNGEDAEKQGAQVLAELRKLGVDAGAVVSLFKTVKGGLTKRASEMKKQLYSTRFDREVPEMRAEKEMKLEMMERMAQIGSRAESLDDHFVSARETALIRQAYGDVIKREMSASEFREYLSAVGVEASPDEIQQITAELYSSGGQDLENITTNLEFLREDMGSYDEDILRLTRELEDLGAEEDVTVEGSLLDQRDAWVKEQLRLMTEENEGT